MLDVHHVGLGVEQYRVGEDSACECTVSLPGHQGEVVLVRREETGFTVALDHGRVRLEAGARFVVELGGVEFAIHEQMHEPRVWRRRPIDRRFWTYNAGSLAVLGGLVVFLSNVPVRASPPTPAGALVEVANVAFAGAPRLVAPHVPDVDSEPEPPSSAPRLGPRHSRGRDLLAIEDPDAPYQPPAMTLNFDPDMEQLRAARSGLVQRSGHFLAFPYDAVVAVGKEEEEVWDDLVSPGDNAPRVRLGRVRLRGAARAPRGARTKAEQILPKLEACYGEVLYGDPTAQGRVTVHVAMEGGTKPGMRIVGRHVPELRACVRWALRGWRLPPAVERSLQHGPASYEFVFGDGTPQ